MEGDRVILVFIFLSIYLILRNQDNDLKSYMVNLTIYCGIFMSIGVLFGLFEYLFLSSNLFYHMTDAEGYRYENYPYIDRKISFSGLEYIYNFSAYTDYYCPKFFVPKYIRLFEESKNGLNGIISVSSC